MIGPMERWEHEVHKLKRDGLLSLARLLLTVYIRNNEMRMEEIEHARWYDENCAFMRRLEKRDPDKALERYYAKKLAQAKAARRRKAAR